MNEQDHGGEFVTIATAAAALGIAPRQARRYAARLNPEDRQEGQGQDTVLRVRFEALARLRSQAESRSDGRQGHSRDRDRDSVPVSLTEATLLRELLAEKDARIRALDRALAEKDRHVADLERNVEDLRRLLPPAGDGAKEEEETTAPRRAWWQLFRRK